MRRRISIRGRVRPSVGPSVRLSRIIFRRVLGASCAVYPAFFLNANGRTYGSTDGPTDGRGDIRTDGPSYRDARTHLKMSKIFKKSKSVFEFALFKLRSWKRWKKGYSKKWKVLFQPPKLREWHNIVVLRLCGVKCSGKLWWRLLCCVAVVWLFETPWTKAQYRPLLLKIRVFSDCWLFPHNRLCMNIKRMVSCYSRERV